MAPTALHFLVVIVAGWIARGQDDAIAYLREENRLLRELLGPRPRLTDAQRRRLAALGARLGRARLAALAGIVTPDTILRWHRRLVARKYDGSARRAAGRPRLDPELRALVARLARENPRWGYTRIAGALAHLGHRLARTTVKRVLAEQGVLPAPERGRRTTWSAFLRAHWPALAAADFFTVEALTLRGLVRYHVLFVIELATRRVEIAGIHRAPSPRWMRAVARRLVNGFLAGPRVLLLDRDPLFDAAVRRILERAEVTVIRLPARSPNLNAYAERFIRSVRSECLDRVVVLGEAHLRHLLDEYLEHYHRERPHQGLGNAILEARAGPANDNGAVRRKRRLGGLLSYYTRGP